MREIKFRFWGKFGELNEEKDECENEMLYGDRFCFQHTEPINTLFADKSFIAMQYTGLKDKNGVEIYEGDIVKYKTYYYSKEKEVVEEVKWIEGGYTDLFGEPSMYGFLVAWGECEIIGNIFENPEIEIDKPLLS